MKQRRFGFTVIELIVAVSSVVLLLMTTWGHAGNELRPDIAEQVLQQFLARLERIENIDLRFSLRVEYFHEAANLDPTKSPTYSLTDGRYVYDVLNDSHYLECRDSRNVEGSLTRTAMRQGIVRHVRTVTRGTKGMGDEESVEVQEGVIYNSPPTAFDMNGPDYFLRISYFQWMRTRPLEGRFALHNVGDGSGDMELVVRPRGALLGDLEKGHYRVYTLSAARGFAPYRIRSFMNRKPFVDVDFQLHEVEPGLWITTGGVSTSRTVLREDPVVFMRKTFEANPESIVINAQILPGLFDLPFPPDTRVTDSINKAFYIEGLQSGQGQRRQVKTFARHADIMAPKKPEKDSASSTPPGKVVAEYRAAWYQSVALWIVVGAVILAVVGFALIRRAG